MQEIISKRTRNSKHYDLGQQQIQTVITKHDQHYHDGTSWQDIVTDWEFEPGFGHKVKKARHNLRFHGCKLRLGFAKGVFVDYTLPAVSPITAGSEMLLVNAWTNTDLKHTVTPEGVKSDIILKQPGHPASFAFPIQTANCTPWVEGNTLVFYRNRQSVGRIPAPYMWDANGEIGLVALDYDGANIRFVPDPVWLVSAVYPIIIDPTTILQPDGTAGIDSWYYKTTAYSGSYGTSDRMTMNFGGANWSAIALKFDLSSIPTGATIDSAVLTM